MADIELVIKMSERDYYLACNYPDALIAIYAHYIKDGIPLPKDHGDLIDKNEIIKRYEKDCGRRIYVDNFIHDIELNMQTIIKADRAERSDKK